MHLYPSAESGDWWKAGYEIWEYGEKQGVRFSRSSGTVGDALAAMEKAGFSHGVAVNLLSVDLFREEALAMLPQDLHGEERAKAAAEIEATMGERFRAANRWLVDALAPIRQLTPYVGVDPWALSPEQNVEHLREMADRGARGINCTQWHSGSSRTTRACVPSTTPARSWGWWSCPTRGRPGAASRSPSLVRSQRCSSSTSSSSWCWRTWVGKLAPDAGTGPGVPAGEVRPLRDRRMDRAPNAPTEEDLARLIKQVGPGAGHVGYRLSWYDLDRTVELVMRPPVLSTGEKEQILGANAVGLLDLPA